MAKIVYCSKTLGSQLLIKFTDAWEIMAFKCSGDVTQN